MTHSGILIVDDNADIRETLRDVFEIEGYSVRTAENGLLGLEMVNSVEPPCLVVLDLMMPVMDGWEFLKRLRSSDSPRTAAIPVTVVSGAGSLAELAELERRYDCNVIPKPADVGRLLTVAQSCCAP